MYVYVSEYTSAFIDKDCAFFQKSILQDHILQKKAKFIFILNVSINLKRNAIYIRIFTTDQNGGSLKILLH